MNRIRVFANELENNIILLVFVKKKKKLALEVK